MAQTLVKTIANFQTQLASGSAVGATSIVVASVTDSDGVALPSGTYGFTIDEGTTTEEHFTAVVTTTNTTLASVNHVTRGTAAGTSGLNLAHRRGATVKITDHPSLKRALNLLDGTTGFDSGTKIGYDADPGLVSGDLTKFATVKYANDVGSSGAADASTTVKGLVEVATQTEMDAGTATGGTGAFLAPTPALIRAKRYHSFAADAGASDAYAITVSPTISAYTDGDVFVFEAATVNTGAATLNVSAVGAKTIKKYGNVDLADADIKAGSIVMVVYDADSDTMMLLSSVANPQLSQSGKEIYAADAVGTDSYAVTLTPAITANVTGMVVNFKAATANTAACTLNVNGIGAVSIKKNVSSDLETGDILLNQIVSVVYDGTNFQLLSRSSLTPGTYSVNADESVSTWFTWELPVLTGSSTTNVPGWSVNGFATVSAGLGAGLQNMSLSNNGGTLSTRLPGNGSTAYFQFDLNKKFRIKFRAKVGNGTTVWGFGVLMDTTYTKIYTAETDTSASQMRIVWNSADIYLANSNGTNRTQATISGITRTSWNLYELVWDGTTFTIYVNGVSKATSTTNIPNSSSAECYLVFGGSTINNDIYVSPIIFSLEM